MPCFSLSYAKGHSASFHVNGTNGFVSGAFLKSYKLYGEIERLLFKEDTGECKLFFSRSTHKQYWNFILPVGDVFLPFSDETKL